MFMFDLNDFLTNVSITFVDSSSYTDEKVRFTQMCLNFVSS